MNKYRIIKLGSSNSYKVQQRIFWVFWMDKMGSVIPITLKEAREFKQMFEAADTYSESIKGKITVVE